jgi:hypothetical protein
LPLIFIFYTQCFATTAAIIFSPKRIVAGIDRMANDLGTTGGLVNAGTVRKITLLRGRFIVACIGLERMRAGPLDKQTIVFDFQDWIAEIEPQIGPNTSVPTLASIVERESAKTFTETVPIEDWMKNGTLKHADAINKFLVQFVVAGFDGKVATLIEVVYELDWQNNRLIGPKKNILLPKDGIDVVLYLNGEQSAISSDRLYDPNSYAHYRMSILAPIAFDKLLASKPTNQIEAISAVRALIAIEGEVDPTEVGSGSTIIVLPLIGNGSIMEYQGPLTRSSMHAQTNRQKNN